MPSHREARRHASPEVRRAQILDAAQTCLARSGYHLTTMDDVVRESGLSKGSLYWHFDSKEDFDAAMRSDENRAAGKDAMQFAKGLITGLIAESEGD